MWRPTSLRRTGGSVLVGLLLGLGTARSDIPVPEPAHSSLPASITSCPRGDLPVEIVIRDFFSRPIPGSRVMLDFAPCPPFRYCPIPRSPFYAYDDASMSVVGFTNALGQLALDLTLGGGCPDTSVLVTADWIRMGRRAMASTDQNADWIVDPEDVARAEAKVGSNDRSADFDGDGRVTENDVSVVRAHLGHACDLATPGRPATWGRLKLLYR